MTAKNGVLLGIGNPLLDISADVSQAILDKYDVKLNNAILAEAKHLPIYPELVKDFQVAYTAGGATQNSIRVAQWLLPAGSTTYIGSIGKDAFGEQLKKCAAADGVNGHYFEDEKTPTGTCAVLVHNKERSLIANLSAANNYKITHLLRPDTIALWLKADVIYSAGFFLTVSPDSALTLAKHTLAAGKIYAANISAPFIPQFFKEPLNNVITYTDYLFGNESEAKAYGEANGWEDTTPRGVAVRLAKLPKEGGRPRVVIITHGPDPTIVASGDTVNEYSVPKIPKEEIVDANGAGDAFVGGFLASLVKGKSIEQCVSAGNYAAGVILRVSGIVIKGTPNPAFL
jgi:adenosine kinase